MTIAITTVQTIQNTSTSSFHVMAIPRLPVSARGGLLRAHLGRKRTLGLRGCSRLLRLRRFIADQTHFAEQVRHLHAGESFEERRDLRGDLGDVAGEFVSASGVAVAGGDDSDFVDFAE